MSDWPRITVAVLSHRRPQLLRRVIGAVAQLDYPEFEIVVIGDQPTLDAYGLPPGVARQVRYHVHEEANISRARNLAIANAGGEVVAFCDDDAAPEPDWLRALALPFRQPRVAAVSGTVLAADGLTVEWRGRWFNHAAREWPDPPPDDAAFRITDARTQTSTGRYVGLIGVNSAFRRAAVIEAGGFDEAYHYFLEETDLAIRLARNGWFAALAPGAVVHHLREQNDTRSATRVPRNLYQIAASKAHFCRLHMPTTSVRDELDRYRKARMAELDPFVRLGALRASGLRKLEDQLDRGLVDGFDREAVLPLSPSDKAPAFGAFRCAGPDVALRVALVSGWGIGPIRRVRALARQLAARGHLVSCFSFLSGPQPARVTFSDDCWLHSGGTWRFGQRCPRGRPLIGRAARAEAEIARVTRHRGFDVIVRPGGTGAPLRVPGQSAPLRAVPARPGATLSPELVTRLEHAFAGMAGGLKEPVLPAGIRRNDPTEPSIRYS